MRVCGLPAGTCWIDSAATPASPAAPSCWNLLSDTGLWPTAGTFLNGDLALERLKDVSVEDLRLTRKLDACLLQPRPKLLAEGLDLLRRLPDLAHPDVVLRPEADVKLAALRGPVPGPRELVADGVVLLLGTFEGGKPTLPHRFRRGRPGGRGRSRFEPHSACRHPSGRGYKRGEGGSLQAPVAEAVDPAHLGVRQGAVGAVDPDRPAHDHVVALLLEAPGRRLEGRAAGRALAHEVADLAGSAEDAALGEVGTELHVRVGAVEHRLGAGHQALLLEDRPKALDRLHVGRVHRSRVSHPPARPATSRRCGPARRPPGGPHR